MPRWSNWWRSMTRADQVFHGAELVPRRRAGQVGGIYNFVTKRGECRGRNSKISWTQVETGSAITWKYPSCVLRGENSVGEFYSVAVTNNRQQADTGTKMIHLGANTRSTIISKGISAGTAEHLPREWCR
jgi:Fe-S cluster assembly protein SufB